MHHKIQQVISGPLSEITLVLAGVGKKLKDQKRYLAAWEHYDKITKIISILDAERGNVHSLMAHKAKAECETAMCARIKEIVPEGSLITFNTDNDRPQIRIDVPTKEEKEPFTVAMGIFENIRRETKDDCPGDMSLGDIVIVLPLFA